MSDAHHDEVLHEDRNDDDGAAFMNRFLRSRRGRPVEDLEDEPIRVERSMQNINVGTTDTNINSGMNQLIREAAGRTSKPRDDER